MFSRTSYIGASLCGFRTRTSSLASESRQARALSPVRGCGKTKLLILLGKLVANPERHGHISASSLYRPIERGAPTLLLDEGDNPGLRIDRVLRSVLNYGHVRGGVITRTIQGEPNAFDVRSGGNRRIGTLPLPLMHRSVVIEMHRSKQSDLKTIGMVNSPEEIARLDGLRRLIVDWAHHYSVRSRSAVAENTARTHRR